MGAALFVLASGFLPWFESQWAVFASGVDGYETNEASAWAASTAWSAALVLNAASAAVAVLLARADHQSHRRRPMRWIPPILSLLGIVLVLWTWIRLPRADTLSGGGWATGVEGDIGDIVRDRLEILHLDGLRYDVGWGLYIGILAMSSLWALLVAQAFVLGKQRKAARP
ncbi:hypothetical protein F6X54_26735 [Micromonospora aurantiaca]|uniref:DUF1772 domain-containing protein n=1 Tax=Micromonospora aurantiaca (nom. illeg.) TaxID=47850 RepID=A0ABQ6UAQ2_9ACTN|nr:hypothetical protein [Micromonospora aurantiaca]KAB1107440.1 hypothetical protein F6X54_26735 [Micromonospora aurantiaca]